MIRLITVVTFIIIMGSACKNTPKLPEDPCLRIEEVLIGTFSTQLMEGTMVFSGGLNGKVDISGSDYNDVECTYQITDCSSDSISINCNGALYKTNLNILSRDSMIFDKLTYVRQK